MKNDEELMEFTPEVCQQINYYVYRLVDPRNGQTFYVGKGKNNRVFAHAKCALQKTNEDIGYDSEQDDDENLKYKTIREIKEAGLEVINIIEHYGLKEDEALLIESVLINTYSIKVQLTNKVKGYESIEPTNALTLQRNLSLDEYSDSPTNPDYIMIKVNSWWMSKENIDRYMATRSAWKLSLNRARNYKYVLSVTGGVVKEVYKVNNWHKVHDNDERIEFDGEIAEKEVRDLFIEKRIPSKYRKKGQASPCLYKKA